MKIIPSTLIREKNKLFTPYPWIVLLDITLAVGTVLYLCSNNDNVTFQGQVYTAFPFYLDPVGQSSKGEIPTLSLKVCNVTQVIHGYLEDLEGAVGATVALHLVNAGYLSEDFSELDMEFSILSTKADAEWITFTLGAPSPMRKRFPRFRFIALHCNWEFKSYECSYGGTETTCNRTFKRCEELANTARFGGFPGLNLKGWRLV